MLLIWRCCCCCWENLLRVQVDIGRYIHIYIFWGKGIQYRTNAFLWGSQLSLCGHNCPIYLQTYTSTYTVSFLLLSLHKHSGHNLAKLICGGTEIPNATTTTHISYYINEYTLRYTKMYTNLLFTDFPARMYECMYECMNACVINEHK